MRLAPLIVISAFAGVAAAADRVPALEPLPAEPALLGYAVIPSLTDLLAHAEAAANLFMPMPEGQLASQAGAMLGDVGFANLDTTRPIVVMVLASTEAGAPPEVSAWIPAKDPAKYVATAGIYKQAGVVSGTLAIIAKTPEQATRAQGLAASYDELAKARPKADLRLRIGAERIISTYGAAIDAGIDTMATRMAAAPRPAGGMDPTAMLTLELRGLRAFARDVRDWQADVTIGETIVSDATVVAAPDSALAKALVAPTGTGAAAAALLGPGDGVLTITGAYDSHALLGYCAKLARDLGAEPGGVPVDAQVLALLDDAAATFTGEMAVRMTADAQNHLAAVGAYGIASPEAMHRLMTGMAAIAGPDGALGKFYAGLGIPMTIRYETAVRHDGDVAIDRMSVEVDASKLPPDQARAMAAMMQPWEFAPTARWALMAQDPSALDALVARSREAAPAGAGVTAAEHAFGAGRDIYIDYDLVGVMRATMGSAAAGPAADLMKPMLDALAALPPEPPILAASTADHGAVRGELRVPLKTMADFSKAMQKAGGGARRQRRQRGGDAQPPADPAPADPAPAKPEF
jgi:hypothetical protein